MYKDVCREDYTLMLAVLRARQLGLLDVDTLHFAIDNRGKGIDPVAYLKLVMDKLKYFNKEGQALPGPEQQ